MIPFIKESFKSSDMVALNVILMIKALSLLPGKQINGGSIHIKLLNMMYYAIDIRLIQSILRLVM